MVHAGNDFVFSVTVFKDVFIKDNACPVVPIKEVYHATNNLCESNFIGEGTAGENFKNIWLSQSVSQEKHELNCLYFCLFLYILASASV